MLRMFWTPTSNTQICTMSNCTGIHPFKNRKKPFKKFFCAMMEP